MSDVIEFKPRDEVDAGPWVPKRGKLTACQHNKTFLITDRRNLECQDCGITLEAFDYLMG